MRNEIIGAAFGYELADVELFLRSAADAGVSSRVVLLRERPSAQFVASVRRIHARTVVWTPPRWRVDAVVRHLMRGALRRTASSVLFAGLWRRHPGSRNFLLGAASGLLHVMLARFLYARQYLLSQRRISKRVLLSDVRDVVFQADPFERVRDGLITGVEARSIQESGWNSLWLYRLYDDPDALVRMRSQPVLCAGVSLGPRDAVVAYLDRMVQEICAKVDRVCLRQSYDQGIHNWLLHQPSEGSIELSHNGRGCIATLAECCNLGAFIFDRSRGLLDAGGRLIPIVHQYDRHPELARYYEERFRVSTEQRRGTPEGHAARVQLPAT